MALAELWSHFKGYVIIRVKGGALETFINTASARGIDLWGITRIDDRSLVARVYLRDLPAAGRVLKETGCGGRVEKKVGVPFLIMRLLKRRGLAAGVILFSVALYALSSFVWFVDVSGLEKAEPEAVLEFVAREGVRPGVLKRSVNPGALSKRILAEFPDFAWAGVQIRGTMVSIEIAEKTLPEVKPGVVDVVAAEDALITNVIVLSGEPVVSEGETVTKGQTLIAGFIMQPGTDEPRQPEVVNAKGIVLGRVWRSHQEIVPLVRQIETPTGRVTKTRRVAMGRFNFCIGPKVPPFAAFVREDKSYALPLGDLIKVPVRVDEAIYREVIRRAELVDKEEALAGSREKAYKALTERLPKGARILDEREDVKYSQDRALVYTCTVETVEDIAKERREERELGRSAH
ncbi:MAG: sporulation protein YqfD [Bacillota bacterium]